LNPAIREGFSAAGSSMKSARLVSSPSPPVAPGGKPGFGLHGGARARGRTGIFQFIGDFFGGGFAPEQLSQMILHAPNSVQHFHHINRDADGARLIGNGARDRLPDPPNGVSGKFKNRADTQTARLPSLIQYCLPGSGPEMGARDACTSWQLKRPGEDWRSTISVLA